MTMVLRPGECGLCGAMPTGIWGRTECDPTLHRKAARVSTPVFAAPTDRRRQWLEDQLERLVDELDEINESVTVTYQEDR